MDQGDVFKLLGLTALLAYLLPGAVRMPGRTARALRLLAMALLAGGILVALVLFVVG